MTAADYTTCMKQIAEILKKRFPNLTTLETIEIAGEILERLYQP